MKAEGQKRQPQNKNTWQNIVEYMDKSILVFLFVIMFIAWLFLYYAEKVFWESTD